MKALQPNNASELAQLIAEAISPFEITGTATKRRLGRPTPDLTVLSLDQFASIQSYEPEELILDVGAGARVTDIEKLISARGQYLAFEPPDYSKLLGSKHTGTMGGLLACNLSGPRRIKAGAARDHILGLSGVSGRGEIFKAGARVVKNVTGYDVPKLMAGSFGTLAVFTSVIFKVLPKPENEETLFVASLDAETAVRSMSIAMQSSCEVSGAAYLPGEGIYLRLEGIRPSIVYRRQNLINLLDRKAEILEAEASTQKWRAIRDVLPFAGQKHTNVWRLSVPPGEAPAIISKLKTQFDFRYYFDWAGGLIWLDVEGENSGKIRKALTSGHATLIRAATNSGPSVPVFQPQEPALAALSGRVKKSFDPRGILNPGRMYEGV